MPHVLLASATRPEVIKMLPGIRALRDCLDLQINAAATKMRIIGTDLSRIYQEVSELLDSDVSYQQRAKAVFQYGNRTASAQIAKIIAESFSI